MALSAGDIAFVFYNSDSPDGFAFVTLNHIPAGEVIRFTDRGAIDGAQFAASGANPEGQIDWTAPAEGVPAGTVVLFRADPLFFSADNPGTVSVGTHVVSEGTFSLNTLGDQILAFQGDISNPTYIAGLNAQGSDWYSPSGSLDVTRDSELPSGLVRGETAIHQTLEQDNMYYNGPSSFETADEARDAINDVSNWVIGDSGYPVYPGPVDFTILRQQVINDGDEGTEIIGTAEDDTLRGNGGDDTLLAGLGDDVISGGAGADEANGDLGNDRIWAGAGDDGNDTFYGSFGDDTLGGGPGDDALYGDDLLSDVAGADLLFGGDGNDSLRAGGGDDTGWAGAGNDEVRGDEGNDVLGGGAGDDTIFGDGVLDTLPGNDTVYAGAGADSIRGFEGDDVLFGGADNDTLYGDEGDDQMYGGAGDDTFVFIADFGNDSIGGFTTLGNNVLDISGVSALSDVTFTQQGDDLLLTVSQGTILLFNTLEADLTEAHFGL